MADDSLNMETFGEEVLSDWEIMYHGWVNEAMTHIQRGELKEAIPYLNLCLDNTNNNNLKATNSVLHANADELNLLEKRCFIHMKLKMYDKVCEDTGRILTRQPTHALAFKCLVAAFCKLNKLNYVTPTFKRWGKVAPKDLEMIKARNKVESLIKAVQNGIEPSAAFSKIEEMLGLKYDWLLGKKVTDSVWKYRPCPMGTEQLVLCLQHRFGHCSLGEKCTEAHSEEELKEWEQRRNLWNSAKQGASSTETDTWTTYMNSISSEIDTLRSDQMRSPDFETEHGIDITSQTSLKCQITNILKPHVYEFQVKSKNYRLTHVSLFDDLHRSYFRISAAYLNTSEQKTNLMERENEDFRLDYDQLLEIPSNLQISENSETIYTIQVCFKTTVFGTFKQVLVFDFDEVQTDQEEKDDALPRKIKVIRDISADVVLSDDNDPGYIDSDLLSKREAELSNNTAVKGDETETRTRSRPKILGQSRTWNFGNSEIVDSVNGNKVCSTKIGFALIGGSNPSPEPLGGDHDILSKHNYKDKMRHFLTQEERARQEILSKYNILAHLKLTRTYEMKSAGKEGTIRYAPEGTLFARLVLFRDVSEDTAVGRLILRNCNFVLISKDDRIRVAEDSGLKPKVYLCKVLEKTKNVIHFDLGNSICSDLGLSDNDVALFQVQFQLDRTSFIQQKKVIDLMKPIHLDFLFPDFTTEFPIPWNPIKQWNPIVENNQFRLNPKQKEALIAVTHDGITPPILIIGPFGTGKTFTLAQCIKTILLQQKTRILICTHSNSAADLYVKEYLDPLTAEFEEAKPLRIYFELRNLATVHATVQKYCKIENGRFVTPTKEEILSHRVIVVTLSTSFDLIELDLNEDTFSHILLDEAAQAMESEAITPLLAAGKSTKLVLAGDYMQLSPELFSASRHFQVSLLERLHCIYNETNPCKILLSENYRSHQAIIQFASDAFYKKKLKCGKQQPIHSTYYPLTFFCARGEDIQEKDSNSYYNMAEVYEVCEKVQELVSSWPESWGNWRDESAIGILTVYPEQVARIRSKLRSKGLQDISVERVLNVQGKQFRAIFLSTVRTSKPWVHILPGNVGQEVDLGFLSNAKLLNTALTRAQSLVAVVGDPVSLCSLGKCRMLWKDFIEQCNENKSLHGISYSQVLESILGTEYRFMWGLNPLANDFEPWARRKHERLQSATPQDQANTGDPEAEASNEYFLGDGKIEDEIVGVQTQNEESVLNSGNIEEETVGAEEAVENGELDQATLPEQQLTVPTEPLKKQTKPLQEVPPRLVAHLIPQSEYWQATRDKTIQAQALRPPQIAPMPVPTPYTWRSDLPPYYPIGPPSLTPVPLFPTWSPTPYPGERYQMPAPVANQQDIPKAQQYFSPHPFNPPWSYPPGMINNVSGRHYQATPYLSPVQLSGVPLQQFYAPTMGQAPRAPHYPRGPSNQSRNEAWSSPGRGSTKPPSITSNQIFTPKEAAIMKQMFDYHTTGAGETKMSPNKLTPEMETLHQKLQKLSTAENVHTQSSVNLMPNAYMNAQHPTQYQQLHYFAHFSGIPGLGPRPNFPAPAPSTSVHSTSMRIQNTVAHINHKYGNGVPVQKTPSPTSANKQPGRPPSNAGGSSSGRSYANVVKIAQQSDPNPEHGNNSNSLRANVSVPNPKSSATSNAVTATSNAASNAEFPQLRPEIVPLMSLPISNNVKAKKVGQTNGQAANSTNKTAQNTKKFRKK